MTIQGRLGRILFALAFIALGAQSLILRMYVQRLETVPAHWPGQTVGAIASGVFLLLAGAGLLFDRWSRLAASALALLLLIWVIVLHLPDLAVRPLSSLSGIFESFALFGAAWVLAALMPAGALDRLAARGIPLGRICFGVSLLVFAATHFIYHDFVASFIPAWIPDRLFFAYATGVAHGAAGLAILSGVFSRLAATLAGIMYGSWALILHVPRALHATDDPFEWNGIFVATALCGGALLVAESFAPRRS